jgi:exosome complex exonuclease RRP6
LLIAIMSSEDPPTSNLFLNAFSDVSSYKDTACSNVMKLIRSSNDLYRASDHDFLMSFAPLRRRMDTVAEKILQNMNSILKQQNLRRDLGIVSWKEADHEDKIEKLIDINDILFERISSSLDEAAGLKKTPSEVKSLVPSIRNVSATWNKEEGFILQETILPLKQQQKRSSNTFSINHQLTKNIPKPQLKFTDKVDNNPQMHFIPKLRTKPNALTPLPIIFSQVDSRSFDSYLFDKHPELLFHPYLDEIEAFEPDESLLIEVEPQKPKPVDATKYLYVDTPDKLQTMMNHIELQSELAIDLEHHSFRSYQGFTCLMQISSRTEDFLIDTLALRDELNILNNIFTNPNIVKVFHGADSDIEWLQKDFGVYVVNMFDTHQAARELNLPAFSLAYLLKSYCDIDANKQFQLADWRIRPLPEEYLHYAREDTHYLLYIYDLLRNLLIKKNPRFIKDVYEKSKIICQKLYKKPYFDDNAYQNIYSKSRRTFNIRQLAALKSLYYWRDRIARQEDESTGYVLPNHMLLQISETLPREPQGVRACCNPVPLLVHHNLHDIHQIILQVRDIPLIEEPKEQQLAPLTLPVLYDPENVLNCPHDTSHQIEQQQQVSNIDSRKKILSNELSSILDETFIEESNKRDLLNNLSLPIQIKTQLLPMSKSRSNISTNFFDIYMPESYRTGSSIEIKPLWQIYYPDRDPLIKGKSTQHDTNNQNGTISKEKSMDDIEVIMLNKQSTNKRKRKTASEENLNNKTKNRRYRRGCVADEVPSTIMLDNDDEEEEEVEEEVEEEPGEIIDDIDERQQKSFKPFNYKTINEKEIFSTKKFKRPADDEDIYEPNRAKKSSKAKTPKRPGAQQTNKSLSYPFPKKT